VPAVTVRLAITLRVGSLMVTRQIAGVCRAYASAQVWSCPWPLVYVAILLFLSRLATGAQRMRPVRGVEGWSASAAGL
jgi:hypothetical protein